MKTLFKLSAMVASLLYINWYACAQRMVKDINPDTASWTSGYNNRGIVYDGKLYFAANDEVHGYELWTTDGTTNGTRLFNDIIPGIRGSHPSNLTVFNGNIYFSAYNSDNYDSVNLTEEEKKSLWISNGTVGNATILHSSSSDWYSPYGFTPLGDKLYFIVNNERGRRIGVTDGTPSGTGFVVPDNYDCLNGLTSHGDYLYFTACNPPTPFDPLLYLLYTSDGTVRGTWDVARFPVRDTIFGNHHILSTAEYNGMVYYGAYELMTYNYGIIYNIPDGSGYPNNLITYNGKLYFTVWHPDYGRELWTSNGTGRGTALFKDLFPGITASNPSDFVICDSKLYFTAKDRDHGRELWVTDGTKNGTRIVKDIYPGVMTSSPFGSFDNYAILDHKLYFSANDSTHGTELWVTDGTEAGTNMVMDIHPGSATSDPKYFIVANDELYFSANDGVHGPELWKYSGPRTPDVSNIIPEHLRQYERVALDIWANIPDWCWTDLLIDWEIDPICPIPEVCADPLFQTTLTGPKGKIVWQETFEKPMKIDIPLEGKGRYQFSLASLTKAGPENLFIMDDDLVGDGFKSIHMSMAPKKDFFNLSVSTEKGKQLPFKLVLLDNKSKTLWEQEFMAPMDKQLKAKDVPEGGTTLYFTTVSDIKDLKDYGITNVNYYPNSFSGALEVEISTIKHKEVPLELTIFDAMGNKVLQEKIVAPVLQPIKLYGQKEGLYIAELRVGEAVHNENIILEY